jgi:hypothetical protein
MTRLAPVNGMACAPRSQSSRASPRELCAREKDSVGNLRLDRRRVGNCSTRAQAQDGSKGFFNLRLKFCITQKPIPRQSYAMFLLSLPSRPVHHST